MAARMFDLTRTETLWIGVFIGFVLAGVISVLMYTLVKIAIVVAVVLLICWVIKKWFTHKFTPGL